jgi:hypothetical protein
MVIPNSFGVTPWASGRQKGAKEQNIDMQMSSEASLSNGDTMTFWPFV